MREVLSLVYSCVGCHEGFALLRSGLDFSEGLESAPSAYSDLWFPLLDCPYLDSMLRGQNANFIAALCHLGSACVYVFLLIFVLFSLLVV